MPTAKVVVMQINVLNQPIGNRQIDTPSYFPPQRKQTWITIHTVQRRQKLETFIFFFEKLKLLDLCKIKLEQAFFNFLAHEQWLRFINSTWFSDGIFQEIRFMNFKTFKTSCLPFHDNHKFISTKHSFYFSWKWEMWQTDRQNLYDAFW